MSNPSGIQIQNTPYEWMAEVFKSVDWVIPAYMQTGFLSRLAVTINQADASEKQNILKNILPMLYNERHLSSMLLDRYSKMIYVRDYKIQISEAIEASYAGLHYAAVATMLPVLEGIVRKIAKAGNRDIGSKKITKKLIAEFDGFLEKEKSSSHRFEERVVMLESLRDFFADKLLKETDNYSGCDQLNRHGILHGIFEDYGATANFYRLITLLELLCFAMTLTHGGSAFAPIETPDSAKLANYYRKLKELTINHHVLGQN